MLLLLALSCLAAAAVGSVMVYQRGSHSRLLGDGVDRMRPLEASSPPLPPAAQRSEATLETLQPGDVLVDAGEDYVVVGAFVYREERETWSIHVVDAGARTRLLDVRSRAGRTSAWMLDEVTDAPVHGQLGNGMTYRNRPFILETRGDARVQPTGDTGERKLPTRIQYARYRGPGDSVLVVETEGQTRRALFGERLTLTTAQILPHA